MSLEPETPVARRRSALHDPQRRGRLIIGGLSLLVSAGYTWQALTMPQMQSGQPGPGLWPVAVGVAWLVISLIVIIEAAVSVQVGGDSELPTGQSRRNVILFFLITVGLVVVMPFIGTYLAAMLYVIVSLKLFSPLPWWKVVVFGAAIGAAITWVFIAVLQVRLPVGPLGILGPVL